MLRTRLYAKHILDGKYSNIDYLTYTASEDGKYHYNKTEHRIAVPADDSLYGTYDKTIKALKLIKQLNIEYDYIFRTNCSTYVNLEALSRYVSDVCNKDTNNSVYAGSIYCSDIGTGPYEWCYYGVGNALLLNKFWFDILINTPVESCMQYNTVNNVFNIDDNAIGLVVNTYCLKHNIDMFGIWKSFNIPNINTIPEDPYNYVAIPFRVYNSTGDRSEEITNSIKIHNAICTHSDDISNKSGQLYINSNIHIVRFSKGTHNIVDSTFADKFVSIMCQYNKYREINMK